MRLHHTVPNQATLPLLTSTLDTFHFTVCLLCHGRVRSGHYGRSSYKTSTTELTDWVFFRVFLRMTEKLKPQDVSSTLLRRVLMMISRNGTRMNQNDGTVSFYGSI